MAPSGAPGQVALSLHLMRHLLFLTQKTVIMIRYLFICVLTIWAGTQVQGQLVTGSEVAVTETDYGKVRGYINDNIFTYKGIPYGKAERFATATEPDAWTGARSSMTYGPVAPLLTPTTTNPQDLINVDMMFRTGAIHQANLKADLAGGAPVFVYLFT